MKHSLSHIYMMISMALTALCLLSCNASTPESVHFQLIYTTDIHGRILDVDFLDKDRDPVSMANVMTYVEQARSNPDQEVVLLDNGDIMQGDPSMYYYNVQAIRDEHLAVSAYNYMGYDAINLGNHDFECGEGIYYDHFSKQCNAHVLAANCIDTRTNEPMFSPYCIIERQGIRLAILGITHSGASHWLTKSMYPHIDFRPMTETVRHWVPRIMDTEHPDMLILLVHAGLEHDDYVDTATGQTFKDDVEEIMQHDHDIDLVLVGHNHQWGIGKIANANGDSILTVQPKSHAEQFATIDFTITRHGSTSDISYDDVHLQDSWRFAPHPAYCDQFSSHIDSINYYLDTPLGTLGEMLDGAGTLVGQTNLMDLVHEVMLTRTGADISMASATSSFGSVPAGKISMRQLFDLYTYENQMTKVWMTGDEVKRFLEFGYGRQFTHMQSEHDHLLNYRCDPQTGEVLMGHFGPELVTPQYNFTSAAGINYTVDVRQPAGQRVNIESMADGSPFSPEHRYIVVLSSFQAAGGGGFITRGLGWTGDDMRYHAVTESTKDIRYFLAQHIRQQGIVHVHRRSSWHVIPTEWWLANKDRDAELLLPYLKH